MTRAFLAVWEGDPRDSEPLLAMLRGAIANEQAATQFGSLELCRGALSSAVVRMAGEERDGR